MQNNTHLCNRNIRKRFDKTNINVEYETNKNLLNKINETSEIDNIKKMEYIKLNVHI